MSESIFEWIQKIVTTKLCTNKKIYNDLNRTLNSRELLYVYMEICNVSKKKMPYEKMLSVDQISTWLSEQNIHL